MAGEDDAHSPPEWVCRDLLCDEVLQLILEPTHELGAWCDAVGIKALLLRQHFALRKRKDLHFTPCPENLNQDFPS